MLPKLVVVRGNETFQKDMTKNGLKNHEIASQRTYIVIVYYTSTRFNCKIEV